MPRLPPASPATLSDSHAAAAAQAVAVMAKAHFQARFGTRRRRLSTR